MSLTVVDDSNIFYGTVQGIDVAGVFIDGCVIMEYQSDTCLVRLTGWISDGQMHTREVHYYTTNDDPVWFVADNIYSKDPTLLNQAMDETPSVDSTWTSWSGFYIDVDGERHDLAGALFSVTKVEGSLLRAEIELSDGSDTTTVVLNGAIVDTYEEDGGTVVTANLLDEAGRLWSLYMTGDVAVIRTVVGSVSSEYEIEMTAVQREYVSSTYVGPPGEVSASSDLLGSWESSGGIRVSDTGGVEIREADSMMEFDVQEGALFSGYVVRSDGTSELDLAYCAVNRSFPSGYIYYTAGLDASTSDVTEGYIVMSSDGSTLYTVSFWMDEDGTNMVSYYEYRKVTE